MHGPSMRDVQVEAWRQHLGGRVNCMWLPGKGHNYISEPPAQLIQGVIQAFPASGFPAAP